MIGNCFTVQLYEVCCTWMILKVRSQKPLAFTATLKLKANAKIGAKPIHFAMSTLTLMLMPRFHTMIATSLNIGYHCCLWVFPHSDSDSDSDSNRYCTQFLVIAMPIYSKRHRYRYCYCYVETDLAIVIAMPLLLSLSLYGNGP